MKILYRWQEISNADFLSGLLPVVPGVYAIYLDGIISYIGSAKNIKRRVPAHGVKRGPDELGVYRTGFGDCRALSIKFRPTKRLGHHLMVECRLISRLRPRFNRPIGILAERCYA